MTVNDKLVAGTMYRIKLSDGSWTDATFLYQTDTGSLCHTLLHNYRTRHRYHFHNNATGRDISIKSMQKIRSYMGGN